MNKNHTTKKKEWEIKRSNPVLILRAGWCFLKIRSYTWIN